MTKTLDELRSRIAPLNEELRNLEGACKSREELAQGIKADIAAAQAEMRESLTNCMVLRASGQSAPLFKLTSTIPGRQDAVFQRTMIALAGPAMIEAMCAEALSTMQLQPTKAARDRRMAELRRELDALELAEERIVDAAERTGNWGIARRMDCRPEIVLHPEFA